MQMTETMSLELQRLTVEQEFLRKLHGFLADGYCLRHRTKLASMELARVKHMANGNEIILRADYRKMSLTQLTNNVKTFERFF